MALIRKPILDLGGRRFGRVVFYHLSCGLICRFLTPHTRKRILKDPRFAGFRNCSKRMAKASKIGSAVYKALPEDFRQLWMYRAFVGEAMAMLKNGQTGEEALESLFSTYAEVWHVKAAIKKAEQERSVRTAGLARRNKRIEVNICWKEYNETNPLVRKIIVIQAKAFNKLPLLALFQSFGMGPPVPC